MSFLSFLVCMRDGIGKLSPVVLRVGSGVRFVDA